LSFGKWLSLGVGGANAVVVALLLGPRSGASESFFSLDLIAISISVGALLGIIHWFVINRLFSEIRQLTAHIESMVRSDERDFNFQSRLGLHGVARAVKAAVDNLRQRVQALGKRRRELEVQMRIAEAERCHAEAILNAISDAVVVTDSYNEIALANDAAARVLEFDSDGARRQPIDQLLDDETLVRLIKDTREGIATGNGFRRTGEHQSLRNGKSNIYDVTVTNLPDMLPQGNDAAGIKKSVLSESAGVVTVLRDVTREREMAEVKRDFVASVSHELRTPLSSIKAYMEILVDGEAHDEQTRIEFYNIIQGETNRLSRLIDNILNINRIESGMIKVQREQLSLPVVVREAVDVMKPQALAKGIELVEHSSPVYFQVFGDRDMIHQASLNLISNAIKYTPPGGRVSVTVDVDAQARMVDVAVVDTGVGIPEADMPHLFEKFYRVDRHKKMAKGTGLGLNLVKQIIETVHGGEVTVDSTDGVGTTFTYRLPLADKV
jgi:two-component system, OmpR family, phosphate regulon sensor histidine kinase PhoR